MRASTLLVFLRAPCPPKWVHRIRSTRRRVNPFPLYPVKPRTALQSGSVAKALNGRPSEISAERGRLLYFSVTTITTLGYGDIVPLTGWARFWTATESFLGIVVVGLFINAVWQDRAPTSPRSNAVGHRYASRPYNDRLRRARRE